VTSYELLVNVLDRLRSEAPAEFKKYHASPPDNEQVNAARSRAFLHLYLKVRFGLLTFNEREDQLTEGTDDGGIDAYYIDTEHRIIYFLQSKFRITEKNFESKSIDPEELLSMDIGRITEGHEESVAQVPYNSRIKAMLRKIKSINDIGRYSYQVVILANVKGITRQKIAQLTGGFPTEVIDHVKCYASLVFPLLAGTFFTADKLNLSLSLSNKSAGAKISYTVATEHTKCEITVVFVPTLEIAKAMHKYRNSILQFNPRSYLGHEGKNVNTEIRKSIESRTTNEFALFNNGLTVLSDESYLNERIGQKDRAQLVLVNPQIINGGQTAYTLSMIYCENIGGDVEKLFAEKEVLVKIITFDESSGISPSQKMTLIEDISRATNQQTAVTIADRRSNDNYIKEFQNALFQKAGILMERKRGEFEDGIRAGYVSAGDIVDRNLIFRVVLAFKQRFTSAASRKVASKMNMVFPSATDDATVDRCAFGLMVLKRLVMKTKGRPSKAIMKVHLLQTYFAAALWYAPNLTNEQRHRAIEMAVSEVDHQWELFVRSISRLNSSDVDLLDFRSRGWRQASVYFDGPQFPADIEFYKMGSDSKIMNAALPADS
jgi:hypothetical protein